MWCQPIEATRPGSRDGSDEVEARMGGRVLLADDDDAIRTLLAWALRHEGCEIVQVRDGQQLLAYLSDVASGDAEPPDVIVSDYQMPGFTGIEVLSRMRSLGIGIPMILITAYAHDEMRAEAHDLGAAAVFEKPFDVLDLTTRVLGLLAPAGMQPC